MSKMERKAQSWSVDVVMAVVVFGFVSIIITSVALLEGNDVESLQANARYLTSSFESGQVGECDILIVNNTISDSSIACLFSKDYESIKSELNLDSDFCIYLEDDAGQVVEVTDSDGNVKSAWGSNLISVGGAGCSA